MLHTRNFSLIHVLLIKLLPIALILAATAQCSAQGLKGSAYMERTISSPKMGYSAVLLFPGYMGDYEIGGFYQKATQGNVNEMDKREMETSLYGLQVGVGFLQSARFNGSFNLRIGLANGSRLAILPSVCIDYMITPSLGIGLGLSERQFLPTYMTKIIIKTNGIGKRF